MNILLEKTRNDLVSQSKRGKRERDGKTRYEKRLKSRFASSVRQYNRLDINTLFKDNILNVNIDVHGETDDYVVKLSWSGFLDEIKRELKNNNDLLDLRIIIRALVNSFNRNDVYIHCGCPDFIYRFDYWCTIEKTNSGEPQLVPADETNPDNDLGPGCKHILLVLGNTGWIIKVASVIKNYTDYMQKNKEDMYARLIYPKLYGKKYEKPTQIELDNADELDTDSDILDKSNIEARRKGQFQQGNTQGVRFAPKDNLSDNQEELPIGDEE